MGIMKKIKRGLFNTVVDNKLPKLIAKPVKKLTPNKLKEKAVDKKLKDFFKK